MRKITLLGIFLFLFTMGFTQNTKSVDTTCEHLNLNTSHQDAKQCNDVWIQLNDIIVEANNNFELNKISIPMWMDEGLTLTDFDVYYYDNNAGVPGNLIGSELNLSPSSQTVLQTSYNYDIVEVIVDVTPFLFEGQADTDTIYWIGIHTNNAGTNPWYIHIETTTNSMVGYPMAQGQVGGSSFSIPDVTKDGVYTFIGDCSSITGINESLIEGFNMHPNPVNKTLFIDANETIDEIIIYSILGEKILISTKNNVDISDLPSGIYLLKAKSGIKEISRKLIKN